jgi:HopA1 effector protein family
MVSPMQLQDSLQYKPLKVLPEQLQVALQEIVTEVKIDDDFCIRNPHLPDQNSLPEMVERFQKLPLTLRNKYLSLKLSHFLYGIYYNGSLKNTLLRYEDTIDLSLQQDLENKTFLGVDIAFYEKLNASNQGKGYFDPGWQILRQESDGSFAVTQGGLILHIERDRHLQKDIQNTEVGDLVAIRLPKNRVQNGFYIAISNQGASHPSHSNVQSTTSRIYFNLSAEGAIAMMESLTQHLNVQSLPFSFKVLYNPQDYGRSDAGVLYFDKKDYPLVRSVLQSLYIQHQDRFSPEVPLFTKQLAPGLAIAEEPNTSFSQQESFGMNRCQIVANGLLESHQTGEDTPEKRLASILKHFSLMDLDLNYPHLNPKSDDIYTALEAV